MCNQTGGGATVGARIGAVGDLLTIGAVAERAGVAPSALRYYEAEGLITSERTEAGHRRFRRDVLRRIALIRVAQRVGLTLDEIRTALASLPEDRPANQEEWERLGASWRPRLDEQIAQLERLRDDLDGCIGCGCLSLRSCSILNPGDSAALRGPGARYLTDPDEAPFA